MADTSNLSNYLKDVADAIREKKGTEEQIPAANFDTEILNIETGSDTSDATATNDDILNDKSAYVNGVKILGNIEKTMLTREDRVFYTRENSNYNKICSLIPDTEKIVTLDYTNWELKVVERTTGDLKSTCSISDLGVAKPSSNNQDNWCISVSERGMFNSASGCIIYVGLTNKDSFAVTYDIDTDTFNVSLNGSVSVWNMPTTTHVSVQDEPRSGKVAFIGTSGKAVTLSHDNNNYVRLYNLTFNLDGTVTRTCPYYDTSSGQHIGRNKYGFGGLTLHNNEAIQYYLTGRNYIFYYVGGNLVKGTNEQNLFVSPSFQKGIIGTTLYDIIPNISGMTYTKSKRADIPELANYTIWRFLNEHTILASDGSLWNKLNVITIDYNTNTISVYGTLGFTNDWKLYTDWNNILQGTGNSTVNIGENMMPSVGISKLYRQAINYYNTEDATAYSNNVEKDKIVYGKNGKIVGTLELSKGNGDVKLFETQQEMQADESSKEGDLAVVYRNEINNMTANTQTQFITFPETVTLLEAFEDSAYIRLIATDSQVMFDGNVQLDKTSFRFDGFSDNGMIRVEYTSTDGITYTRNTFEGDSGELSNPVDLGTLVKYEEGMGQWDDVLGYFMQVGGKVFEGLFEYKSYTDSDIYLPNYSTLSYSDSIHIEMSDNILSLDRVKSIINALDKKDYITYDVAYDGTYYYVLPFIQSASMTYGYYDITNNKLYFTVLDKATDSSGTEKPAVIYVIDNSFKLSRTINISELNEVIFVFGNTPANYYKVIEMPLKDSTMIFRINNTTDISLYNTVFRYAKGIGSSITSSSYYTFTDEHPLKYMYKLAPTQLSATTDNLYNTVAYGKNGVVEGTLTQNVSNSFTDINAEVYIKLKNIYDNMSPKVLSDDNYRQDQNIQFVPINNQGQTLLDTSALTTMSNIFYNCTKLTYIPSLNTSNVTDMTFAFNGCTNLISGPEMDTSNVTKMNFMFAYDTNLINIPVYDASSVKTMSNMFYQCPNLSDDSLNNIMQMCISTTDLYTGNKTLSALSISSEQAERCKTLSNYEAFTAAGWTTGY